MGKKLTIKFIREQFEREGYTLLTDVYKDAHKKLKYICPNGHEHEIVWNKWQQGQRCSFCANERCAKKLRTSFDIIKKAFNREGYRLVTTEYRNNDQKLVYICPKGHIHSIRWMHWKKGHRCPYCVGVGKPTIEFIKKKFEQEGYKLLATIYINNNQKLEYLCPFGHRYSITWHHWQRGCRCFYCAGQEGLSLEFIRDQFEKVGYTLLAKKYINSSQKLEYICVEGHKSSMSWDSWKQGHRCPICSFIKKSGSGHWNWKGGISCEPYCDIWLDKKFKESVKQRDDYKCMNPNCWGTSARLSIHHIDYNKKNCAPNNLITLCNSCNSRANKDRNWHESWYQTIMYMRYGYKYFEVGT
jgi:hypothetical protein